jgi:peptidoglycan/xylan/chitin deacetylase (PgdA/CDA1 family)
MSTANITRPIASLSLDVDNQWSYMKTHGDAGWDSFPSYLDVLVPRVLEFLRARKLKITFFIVGQDAALEKNVDALKQIADAGHDIGNHSFNHEPWMHLYQEAEIDCEIARTEEHIGRVTGRKLNGFRGPGYACSPMILRVLKKRDYLYDASTLPTYLGPLARAYYFMKTKLPPEEKERRKTLFGKWSDGRQPLKPYRWAVNGGTLIEIPLTTMPIAKTPIHFSYLIYLSVFSRASALAYFRSALKLCKLVGIQPSLLLHPLDFLGGEDVAELSFFPGMNLHAEKKLELVSDALRILSKEFAIVDLAQHAKIISAERNGPVVSLPT